MCNIKIKKSELVKALEYYGYKFQRGKDGENGYMSCEHVVDESMFPIHFNINFLLKVLDKIPEKKEETEKEIIENDQEFAEDIMDLIRENPDIKISTKDLQKISVLKKGTLLHFKKEFIQGGMEFKDFEVIDDEWVGDNMFVKNKEKDKNSNCIFSVTYPNKYKNKVCKKTKGIFLCNGEDKDKIKCPYWNQNKSINKHNWQFAGRKIMGSGEFELCKDGNNYEIQKNYLEFVCECGATMRVLEREVEE